MNLPERRDILIRGAYVMTMDPELGDLKAGDVHVQGDRIANVGQGLSAAGAVEIDGGGMIVLPGLVDTHTHLWTSQMRGRFGDTPDSIYFRTRNRLAKGYTAADMYHGSRLGATECVFSGITTAWDFCHNAAGSDFILACLKGLGESGLRARFLMGATPTMHPTEPMDLDLLRGLVKDWAIVAGPSPLTLGLAWRGPLGVTGIEPDRKASPAVAVARSEFEAARSLGLPIAVHVSGINAAAQFEGLVQGNYLGPDVQLIHLSNATSSQLRIVAETDTAVSLTPYTELRVGYGITNLGDYLDSGARVGVGIDSTSLAGGADLFGVLKLFQLLEAGRKKDELAISARRLLELATIAGARAIGMEAEIGSLTPGKKADVIMVDPRAINLGMFADDPTHLLVEAARPHNVDTVVVDGRILKRHGKLTAVDADQVVREAAQSMREIDRRVSA
ncbi:MAG TPA: amidohydrolase family protein [Ramlibacter sp.]|nr:amidohydrolase family protein [Ramlibacter sp.]